MRRTRLSTASGLAVVLCAGIFVGCAEVEVDQSDGDEPVTTTWDAMTQAERFDYMATVVTPQMASLFQSVNPEYYADFTCSHCHGDNAESVGFKMPNELAPLTFEEVQSMFASEDPVHRFMVDEVWPEMSELLGYELYDPSTNEGFSCFGCHALSEE